MQGDGCVWRQCLLLYGIAKGVVEARIQVMPWLAGRVAVGDVDECVCH